MTDEEIEEYAATLWAARVERRTLDLDAVEARHGPLTDLAAAYAIGEAIVRRRLARGERPVGWKLGYTSLAMRRQMGVDQPNHGVLTDAMLLADGAELPEGPLLQPRVEPEVAVRLGRDLSRPPGTAEEVLDAVDAAYACLEVVDSVWDGYRFRIEHNTADGSSAAYVVLGPAIAGDDLAATTVELARNGDTVASATGAAASGHPLAGVVWLARALATTGRHLRAGEIVITGGLTAAVPIEPGDRVDATFDGAVVVSVRRAG